MDLSILPLAFNLILTVSSRLLHLYSIDDKTSMLLVKRFSTVRNTKRDSELHAKEKREVGDCGDQEEKGESKGERPI